MDLDKNMQQSMRITKVHLQLLLAIPLVSFILCPAVGSVTITWTC